MKKYLYGVNYQFYEKNLCLMELKYILNEELENDFKDKYLFSDIDINPSRSPFIKYKISVIHYGETLEEILGYIKANKVSFDDFKVNYIKSEDGDVEYSLRLDAVHKVGYVVTGYPDLHNPKVNLAITKVKDLWVFGIYEKNDSLWQLHDKKPHSYSNGLSTRMARAIINIAVGNDIRLKVIDPCCGVGTVVIEGLDQGIDIRGYEISKAIACNGRNNIEFLGYDREIIKQGDMHLIDITSEDEKYDVSIIDIPYGIFSPITAEEQQQIINTARRISKKMILITFEDMCPQIEKGNFKVVDHSCISKNRFTRHIYICS